MTLVVTGATGHLGRLVVESLLSRGVPAGDIVAAGRSVEKLADLGERGVRVARIDFEDAASLDDAFKGADRVLLVSGTDFGKRTAQHTAAVEAAVRAGVSLLVYTSIAKADTTSNPIAPEHLATEQVVRGSGLPFTFLRNGWYLENYTGQIPQYLQFNAVLGAAGEGRISAATRADFADAAAAVLTGEGHENAVYELGGDQGFTLAELAASVAKHSGQEVGYTDLPEAEFTKALEGAGLPAPVAGMFAAVDTSIKAGDLEVTSGDLSRLTGRPTTSLDEAVAQTLAG